MRFAALSVPTPVHAPRTFRACVSLSEKLMELTRMNGHDLRPAIPEVEPHGAIARGALTKEELQNLLFDHIGLSKRECREMVNAIFEEMRVALEAGDAVKLEGFGRFQPKERPKRWARNLKSGEKIPISERRVVTFHPSKKLTSSIDQQKPPAKMPRQRAS